LVIAGLLVFAVAAIAFALSRTAPADAPMPREANGSPAATTPAPVAAAASPSPALDGDALLQRVRASSSTSPREWQSLVATWKAPIAMRRIAPDACPPVPAPGWRCLRSRASLDQLLRFDRPVLLRLRAEPQAVWASLLDADAERVHVSLDGSALVIDRVALAGVWNGEYLAIWPAPDAIESAFAAGDATAIAWVRRHLDPDGAHTSDLTAGLRAFQARHGLRSDGILGPDTLFALSSRDRGPQLSAPEE
jgi:general secretion pathway protein A